MCIRDSLDAVDQPLDECAGQRPVGLDLCGILFQRPVLLDVYKRQNEAIIRLTREDFASEEEFLKWKSLSDADYHASEKEDHVRCV